MEGISHAFFEFCCLHETLIKTKRNGCFFGMKFGTAAFFAKPLLKQRRNWWFLEPRARSGGQKAPKTSQTLMIHKVSAKSLKKQACTQNELKRAYNSLSKSSFAKKWFFMKNTIQNAYNSLSKSSFLRFTVFSKISFKKSSNSLSKLVLF